MARVHVSSDERLRLDDYLERVRYTGPLAAAASVLEALHEAHLAHIPFENLDILLGRTVRLDLASLQAKLVADRRGGYCFEQNTLFRAVLEAVGFGVDALAARVRVGSDQLRARTHMLLRVTPRDAKRSWIADVGFGGDGFLRPMPLEPGAASDDGTAAHRLEREDDNWVLQTRQDEGWTDLYAFTLEPHYPVDFEVANHYTSTHPSSPFVRGLTAQRLRADARRRSAGPHPLAAPAARDRAVHHREPRRAARHARRTLRPVLPGRDPLRPDPRSNRGTRRTGDTP